MLEGMMIFGFFSSLIAFAITVCAIVFWIMMLVHLVTHDIENKLVWVIIVVFTGIVGAIIYYFVVKQNFHDKNASPI